MWVAAMSFVFKIYELSAVGHSSLARLWPDLARAEIRRHAEMFGRLWGLVEAMNWELILIAISASQDSESMGHQLVPD